MASELAQEQGVRTERVKVWDDVASAPPDKVQERGGLAADLFVIKVAGARAENGGTIEEVVKSAETAGDNCITYAVALSPATVPSSAKPTFTIGEDEMFFGIGAHGEKGVSKTRLLPANDTAKMLVDPVVKDLPFKSGDQVNLVVNGYGSTEVHQILGDLGIRIHTLKQ